MSEDDDDELCTSTASTLAPCTSRPAGIVYVDQSISADPPTLFDASVELVIVPEGMFSRASSVPLR